MAEHNKHSSNVKTTADMQLSQGRRRLVRDALLATPAVMTLMSGRLASAASATVCQPPVNPVPGTGSYVDANGLPLEWGIVNINGVDTPVLGYYENGTFHQSTPAATSSCWISLGHVGP